jgi:hypothetical protein
MPAPAPGKRHRTRHWIGATWWTVTVIADNERAAELYEREGFRPFWQSMVAPIQCRVR